VGLCSFRGDGGGIAERVYRGYIGMRYLVTCEVEGLKVED